MSAAATTTTEITTEYGIRQPNGREAWGGKVTTRDTYGSLRDRNMREIHDDAVARRHFIAQLHATADGAGVDKDEFVAGHRLITRQRINIVLAPVDADPTIQFGNINEDLPF